MKINVHAGHNPDGKIGCGAIGLLKESTEARNVKNEVIREINKFNLGSYLNIPEIEEIARKARQRVSARHNENNNEEEE